ncbi:hypothetical protein KC949_02725 [Candidatus Saccharibacteria bacterium]|nr:hypothetical protein [Candidatus Saccharibacteria bacterium]
MNLVIILGIVVAILFVVTYFTRRRFGVLGLALCAGYLLETMWTSQVTPWLEGAGVELISPPLASVVSAVLVLLPAVLLFLSGPASHGKVLRVLNAAVFALLATSFLIDSFGSNLVLDSTGEQIYRFLTDNKSFIITGAIVYALYDILTMRKHHDKS